MKIIDITQCTVKDRDGKELEYDVQKTICFVLFHNNQEIGHRDAIKRDAICRKIEAAIGNVLLEDAEYELLKKSFESARGFGRGDVEMINRVMNAENYEIK